MKTKLSFFSVVFCYTLLAFTISSIHDHSFGYQWSKTFGGADSDIGLSVQQTDDSGFIIAGYTDSFGAGDHDVYLIKTDNSGDELWSKTFGGIYNDVGRSVQQTNDGGFIIAGQTQSFGAGESDVYLIKTDASGGELWSKTFGGAGNDYGHSVQQTDDGGFIIAGSTSSFGVGGSDVYLIKTDASGNEIWSKTFGGAGSGSSVQQTDDGGFIIAGSGGSDVYLIKTDASGDELWSKTFGTAGSEHGHSVQQTDDGGFIIAGRTSLPFGFPMDDVYLIRTDASGDEIWSKTFGGADYEYGHSVQQTDDGGFIIAGATGPWNAGVYDVYLFKTDASGIELWSKTFGGASGDEGHSVQQTDDGGFIIAGETQSFGAGSNDIYLVYYQYFIAVSSPNGGEELIAGETYEITWTSVGASNFVKIEYSANNGATWIEIVASTENDGSYMWEVPSTLSEKCFVRISDINSDESDESNGVFTILRDLLIAGYVTEDGAGIENVHMNDLPGDVWTDTNGFYSSQVNYGWSGTVTPTKHGYTFEPVFRNYSNVNSDQLNQNYEATAIPLVDIGSDNGRRGGEATIPIIFTPVEDTDVSAVSVDVGYDTNVFDNPSAEIGPAAKAAGKSIATNVLSPGVFRVSIFSSSNNRAISIGIIAYLKFNIKADAPFGTTILSNTPSASDPLGVPVLVGGLDGTVDVTEYTAGDCNENGSVTIDEVQYAANMFIKITPVEDCVDANSDGKVKISEIQKVINNHLMVITQGGFASLLTEPAGVENFIGNGFPSLDILRVYGKAGETVRVPITLNNASGYEIAAVSVDISFDTNVLENPTAEIGPVGSAADKDTVFSEISPGILRVGVWGINQNIISDGIAVYVTFNIKFDAIRGQTALINAPSASDPSGYDVPVNGMNGAISINMANTAPWLILLLFD